MHSPLKSEEATASSASMLVTPLHPPSYCETCGIGTKWCEADETTPQKTPQTKIKCYHKKDPAGIRNS